MVGSAQAKDQVVKTAGSGTSSGTTQNYGTTGGTTTGTSSTSQQTTIPDWLKPLIKGSAGVAGTSLTEMQELANQFQIDPTALKAMTDTARGDFLYGGAGMDAFTDAAQRAAMPGILSTFGGAGRGTGGLAQHAIGQSGIDAFANMFSQERNRQLQAAQQLPQWQMLPFELQQKLLAGAGAMPGAFAPLFGQTGTSTNTGTYTGTQSGTTNQSGTTTNKGTQATPMYDSGMPSWLGPAAAGLGFLASPMTGGASMAAAGAAPTVFSSLLGAFR